MDKMTSTFKVGKWTVTPTLCEISDGENTFHLEPKSMDLLLLLARANGELVTRKEIMDVVWKDRVVTEYALNNLISGLRKHLNNKNTPEAYIATRPKLGYQLITSVTFIDHTDNSNEVSNQSASKNTNNQHKTDISSTETEAENQAKHGLSHSPSHSSSRRGIYFASFILLSLCITGAFLWWLDTQEPIPTPSPSIVVLPFDVFDSDEDIGYFADGLAEEIIHQLTVVDNLKVISRTSSFYFRDKDLSLTEIAQKLDVSYVLEGSVRQAGDNMRVTVQLIRAQDDSHIWSKVFTASQQNKFSVQHDISTEVAHSIDASFVKIPDNKRIFTPNSSEAYLRVLKGRKLNNSGTPDDLVKARDEFMMATLLEPDYADAYVDLGLTYLLLIQKKKLAQEDAIEHATKAISRALEINPELASAHAAHGVLLQMTNRWREAWDAFSKALDINPDLYVALINFANFNRTASRYLAALEYYQRARKVAPLSGPAQWGLGNVLLRVGRIDDSIRRYRDCVNLLSDHVSCHYGYAYALRLADQNEEADAVLEKIKTIANNDDYWFRATMGFHHLWKGNFETSNTLYEGMIEQFGLNNDIVLSMPVLKLKLGEITPWMERLETILQPDVRPKARVAVHAGYAISAYYAQQCTPVISTFEKIIKHRYFMVEEIEPFINAINYLAMLAHCYQIEGQTEDFIRTIALSQEVLSKIPENSRHFGGFKFSIAQTTALKGNTEEALQLIDELQSSSWSMKWLIEVDPILRTLTSTDLVAQTSD